MARLSQLFNSPSVRRAAESFLGGGTSGRTTTAPRRRGRPVQSRRGGLGGSLLREVSRHMSRRRY